MIFQHPETGLRVAVVQSQESAGWRTIGGDSGEVMTRKSLETEAGQHCVPASHDDYHELRAIRVFVDGGEVVLVKVE